MWASAAELLRRATHTILDDGFFLREHRRRHIGMAGAIGARTTIQYIHAPLVVIRRRLERRNEHLPPYNPSIDPNVLAGFVGLYEVPSADEGAEIVSVDTGDDQLGLDVHWMCTR